MLELRNMIHEMLYYRTRLVLTIVAIAWGTISITLMLSIGEGLRQSFSTMTHATSAGLINVTSGSTGKDYHGRSKGRPINLSSRDVDAIKKGIPNIKNVYGIYRTSSLTLKVGTHNTWNSPVAVPPEFAKLSYIDINAPGRFINSIDMRKFRRVIVLGDMIAKNLFGSKNALGRKIKIGGMLFTVIGVRHPSVQIISFISNDSASSWIPLSTYQLLSHHVDYTDLVIVPKSQRNHRQIMQSIRKILASTHHVDPNDQQFVQMYDSVKEGSAINHVFSAMRTFLGVIGGITLLVAGIGVANVMFASVKRATKMIGVKMAMGARSHHILLYYAMESMLVTFLGGLIGIGISAALVLLFRAIPIQSQVFINLGRPEPVLSLLVVLTVVFVLGLIGLVAGVLPARKAAAIDPVEALRDG